MQPYLFPYLGYFQLVHGVDRFVVYDDVHYIKGGWINRNRILVGGKAHLFTLPPSGASPNRRICDVGLTDRERFRRKFLRSLAQEYRHAPFYDETVALLDSICAFETRDLADFLVHSLVRVCGELSITTEFVPTSRIYGNEGLRGQERVLDICAREGADTYINPIGGRELYHPEAFAERGVELRFLQMNDVEYPQGGGDFVPGLSIVDVMMWNPRPRIAEMLEAYSLV